MASIHSRNLEIYNATNFVDKLNTSTASNLYFTFGRTIPWSTDTVAVYSAEDVRMWYRAIQTIGATKNQGQVAQQELSIPTFVGQLNNGTMTPLDVQNAIINDTFTQNIVFPIVKKYLGALQRYPDTKGFASWVEQLSNGLVDLTQLNSLFVTSTEFINLFQIDASKPVTLGFMSAFYANVLNRPISGAEIQDYTNNGITVDEMIRIVTTSFEFDNLYNGAIKTYLLNLIVSSEPVNTSLTQPATEGRPPSPDTSTQSFNDYWRNLIGGKKITGNDVSLGIPRYNWVSGQVYTQYDDRLDSNTLLTAGNKFFVVTKDFNVYKCLYNNNGSPSIEEPTLTLTSATFQTSDKYIWKYMYSISSQDQLRFMTNDFIPVKTLKIKDGSSQWEVQNTAIDGSIYVCQLSSNGSGYVTNDVFVQITGDGTGANAFALIDTNTHKISEIVIDNEGYGYTRANVGIFGGNGSGAIAHAIISPPGGHGKDAVTELGGSYVIISSQFNGSESGEFLVSNEYRQVGILQDPIRYDTSNLFSNLIFSQASTVIVSGPSVNYLNNEYVYQGNSMRFSTFRGTVLNWDQATNQLKLIGVDGDPSNDTLIGYSSAAAGTLISLSVNPSLKPHSGKLLYIDNIPPIQRDASQTENFKVIIKF